MRIAVLSDIHSNLVALDAILAHAGPLDAIWHLGDVVGYGPDPDGVVARLAESGAVGVRGNHDAAAIGGPEIEWFNPEARAAIEWTRDHISPTTRDWLAAHPERRVMGDVTLVHGSPRDPLREYVTSKAVAAANFRVLETGHALHGHTHVPLAFLEAGDGIAIALPTVGTEQSFEGQRSLINPGSVGQPRDGDPAASYLILDPDTMTASWQRVPYDIAAVQAAMLALELPRRLADRLSVGL
ncbi:MAG: metallophosphoesterase family protein [Chloroflexi bacterium]|nr:metallophosphoesterase family protein [Chloroflexota bacterium]